VNRLILASSSPRRAQLLREAGYAFTVQPANVDEDALFARGLSPTVLAAALAAMKADAVAARFPDDVTLAADTVVALGDAPIAKPADERDAREMIRRLSGTTHTVITGVALRHPAKSLRFDATATSSVNMRRLSDPDIDQYLATGLWHGKAGGYGIQDPDPIVSCIAGSFTNVIGLPMELTRDLLAKAL
jgi:septum formation protein